MDREDLLAAVHEATVRLSEAGSDRAEQRDVILSMAIRWAVTSEGLPPDHHTAKAHARKFVHLLILAIEAGVLGMPRGGLS